MKKLKKVRELVNQFNAYNEHRTHCWHYIFAAGSLYLYTQPGPNSSLEEWGMCILLPKTKCYNTLFLNPKCGYKDNIIKKYSRIVDLEQKMDSKAIQIDAILNLEEIYLSEIEIKNRSFNSGWAFASERLKRLIRESPMKLIKMKRLEKCIHIPKTR